MFAVLLATFAKWLTSITLVRLSLCKVERFSSCPPLAYQSFQKFLKLSNKQHMGSFYAPTCSFISDFRQVVNINYVSSPKFVQSRKVLLMSAACLSKFSEVFEAFQQTAYGIFLCANL